MVAHAGQVAAELDAGLVAFATCDWHGLDAWMGALCALAAASSNAPWNAAWAVQAFATGLSDEQCAKVVNARMNALRATLKPIRYPPTPRLARRRLRVGYLIDLSGDSWQAALVAALCNGHARERFEIFVYAFDHARGGRWRPAIEDAADTFRPVAHLLPHEAFGLVRCDDIDVLIDVGGVAHDRIAELLLYAPARVHLRPACIPGAALDMSVTMPPVLPPGSMVDSGAVAGERAIVHAGPGTTLLGCFAGASAIGPQSFDAWMRILAGAPDTRLALLEVGEQGRINLQAAMRNANIDPRRLVYFPCASERELPALCRRIDVCLDTLGRGDAGFALAARGAGAPLVGPAEGRLEGMGKYAAHTRTLYIDLALALCRDPALRSQARADFTRTYAADAQSTFDAALKRLEEEIVTAYAERASLASAKGM